MEKKQKVRYPQAIHAILFGAGIIAFLLAGFAWKYGIVHELLVNLGGGFIVVSLVFYFVEQFFDWKPYEERLNNVLRRFEDVLKKYPHEVDYVSSKSKIYNALRASLKEEWIHIYVFAPNGFWRKDDDKKQWLVELSQYVSQRAITKELWVTLVFGLPPKEKSGKRNISDVIDDLYRTQELLFLFDRLENVRIQYLPPAPSSIGLGASIFVKADDTGFFTLGFASHTDDEVVDRGFVLTNKEIFDDALVWYRDSLLSSTSDFVLQGGNLKLQDTWNKVIIEYYSVEHWRALEMKRINLVE